MPDTRTMPVVELAEGHVIVTKAGGSVKVLAVHDLTHLDVRNVTVQCDCDPLHKPVWGYGHHEWVDVLDGAQ